MLKVDDRIAIPLDEFRWEVSRSGGPGGQNVNKVNSKVLLRWNPSQSKALPEAVRARLLTALEGRLTRDGELLVGSQRTRDQSRNLADCLEKVRAIVLASAKPPIIRRPTRPTQASKVRRLESKERRSTTKRLRRSPDSE
jgi:ribosome-associated protein